MQLVRVDLFELEGLDYLYMVDKCQDFALPSRCRGKAPKKLLTFWRCGSATMGFQTSCGAIGGQHFGHISLHGQKVWVSNMKLHQSTTPSLTVRRQSSKNHDAENWSKKVLKLQMRDFNSMKRANCSVAPIELFLGRAISTLVPNQEGVSPNWTKEKKWRKRFQ